jgi:DNA-binding transcriptional ArsR family regulator
VIASSKRASVLLHPLRREILQQLDRPDSAAGLSRRMSLPRQKLNYHLRELEKEGLVELVEERRKGNCTERVVKASARSYLISPELMGRLALDPDKIPERLSSTYLVALAARAITELAWLRERASEPGKKLATMSLQAEIRFASTPQRNAFAAELAHEVARLVAKYNVDEKIGGQSFRLIAGAYPRPRAIEENPGIRNVEGK